MKPPKARPCGSCPYRRDVPAGVWHPSEYMRLIPYDRPTTEQPVGVFGCHQQDGHLCAGWVGCHDMEENLALRLSVGGGFMTAEEYDACLNYESAVPLWVSGMEAAAHGLSEIKEPSERAQTVIRNLKRKGLTREYRD